VVASFHWGDGNRPFVLTQYERDLAHAAVDAGADVVLGHHHHMLRGVEIYRDTPIFYGLSHFVFDQPRFTQLVPESVLSRLREASKEYAYGHRDDYPLLPMHPDARMTVIGLVDLEAAQRWVGGIPVMLNPEGQPVPLSADDPLAEPIVTYLNTCNQTVRLPATWRQSSRELAGLRLLELR
jgi:poly-gamma-glutamate synthesis protein (capsule biosynthesis protein)